MALKKTKDGHLILGPGHKVSGERHDFPTAKGDYPVMRYSKVKDLKVACHNCDWKGRVKDMTMTYSPIGHGRWTRSGCPECEYNMTADYNGCRRHKMADEYVIGLGLDPEKHVE